jgi:hypothetical protein
LCIKYTIDIEGGSIPLMGHIYSEVIKNNCKYMAVENDLNTVSGKNIIPSENGWFGNQSKGPCRVFRMGCIYHGSKSYLPLQVFKPFLFL